MVDYTIEELLDEYIFQRESHVSSEQAIELINEFAPNLDESDRRQLAHWIREWELGRPVRKIEYRNEPVERERDISPTIIPQVSEEDTELLDQLTSAKASTAEMTLICPHCYTKNAAGEVYCYACGQVMELKSADPTDQLYEDVEDAAIFGTLASLTLTVAGHEGDPLRIQIGDGPVVVGRGANNKDVAYIDLAGYGASELGVSRMHAAFMREERTLLLVDKGSMNHTYINGDKVHPHEKRVVRDGDEVRFGRLTVRVTFHRSLRRL